MDLLNVVIRADTSGSDKAAQSLDNMTSSAKQADAAVRGVGTGSSIASGAVGQTTVALDRATASARANATAMQAQAAATKMATYQRAGLATQLVDTGQTLALGMNPLMVALQQGPQIFSMYGNSVAGLGQAFKDLGAMALGVARVFMGPLGLAFGAAVGLMAGLTHEINETASTQVSMLDVMQAGWQLFAEGVGAVVAPVFGQIGSWLQQGWEMAVPILKGIGNTIIGAFAFAIQAVGSLWNGMPAAVGEAIIKTANVVISGLEWTINRASEFINGFIEKYNTGLAAMGQQTLPTFGGVQIPRASNPYEGAMGSLGTDIGANAGSAFSTDYMGEAFGALSGRAQKIARARAEAEDLDKAAVGANKSVKNLANDGMTALADKAFDVAEGLRSAFQGIGSGIFEAFKKGGDIAGSVLDMLMGKLEQFASSWLDNIINNGIDALFSGFGSFGIGSGLAGTSSITGSSGGFFPGFASGTSSAPGGMAWVGERGPELINLPRGAQVFNHQQSMAMAANSNRPVSVQTNIINNAGVEVVENTTDDGNGGVRQEIVLNRAVANAIGRPGPAQKAVRNTGRLVSR